jgi:hypothetical protein
MASVTTGQFSRLTCSQTALSDSSEILIACSPVPCGARRWLPTANIIGPISSGQSQRGIQALIVGVPSIFKGQYCTSQCDRQGKSVTNSAAGLLVLPFR